MKNWQYKLDILPGIVLALVAVFYMTQIPKIQTFTGLGATPMTNHFVPYLWGTVLLILSIWIIIRGLRKRNSYLKSGEAEVHKQATFSETVSERREVIASFVLLFLYVTLMEKVGFIIMSIIYVTVQTLLLTGTEKWKKTLPKAVIIALIVSFGLYYLFAHVLNVLLPAGIFSI